MCQFVNKTCCLQLKTSNIHFIAQIMSNAAYKSVQFQTNKNHRGKSDSTEEVGDD